MAKKNYYKILGVSRTASPEEISAAKNRLAKKYHPDANMKDGIDTTKKMQRILEAYRILSDPKKRASYDRKVFGKPSSDSDRNFDLFNLHNNIEETDPVIGTPFVNYWRAADSGNRYCGINVYSTGDYTYDRVCVLWNRNSKRESVLP